MMGAFLEAERRRQEAFKASSTYFSGLARADGAYRGKPRSFCLPTERAAENLFEETRYPAIDFFSRNEIKWHQGEGQNPTNHLCSSQVYCVNFLFSFANKPEALAELLRPVYPMVQEMLPIEGQFVSFEWIGKKNYLGERIHRGGKRTRGANFTSADAIVMFERIDGLRQIVLIEWKYTESYAGAWLRFAPSGTDRTKIYCHIFQKEDCPLNKSPLPSFATLFFEPFYQLMRQQFLAHEMELAHELGADIVSVLHISDVRNSDFHSVTSPELRHLGETAIGVWNQLMRSPDRFASITTQELFGQVPIHRFPKLTGWRDYISTRYGLA